MFKNIKKSTAFVFGSTLTSIAVSLSPVQSMDQKGDDLGVIQPCRTSTSSLAIRRVLESPRPWHNQSTSNNTAHVEIRKEQREISNQDIQTAKQSGIKEEHKNSTTYTNETTKVVSGKNGKVITVIDNKRNTNFDLLKVSENKEKRLIKKVNYQNNDSAMCELAQLYLSGDLGNREIRKAYDLLLRAANRGNSHAMCLLSSLYENGDLGKVDRAASLEWLEQAAKRNNLGALAKVGQYYLGEYLKIRKLDSIDEQEKNNLIQKTKYFSKSAADKGQTRAIWSIGKIHEEGYFGEKNLSKAIEFYTKAAKLGSPSSLDSLNKLVLEGGGKL